MNLIRSFTGEEKEVKELKNKAPWGGDTVTLSKDDIQHLFLGGKLYGHFNDEYIVTIELEDEEG